MKALGHHLLGGILLAASPSMALARIEYANTVEWLTADADVVVRGGITEIRPGAADGSHLRWYEATVNIAETLKGTYKGQLTFAFSTARNEPFRWRNGQAELLLFLRSSQRVINDRRIGPPPSPLVLGFGGAGWEAVPLDSIDEIRGVPTLTFRMLTDRDEILAAARCCVAASLGGDKPKRLLLDAPGSSEVYRMLHGLSTVEVVVPLDRHTEQQAQRWAKTGEHAERIEAIKVLRHFRSDENIAVLRGLLSDRSGVSVTGDGRTRSNLVRRGAYKLLHEWGVEVEDPGFEEPTMRVRK